MTQGFVTIATGDERYYRMARTLLRSYRQTCEKPIRFALIADRENEYTKEFDDVVILPSPALSWMDKIALLQNCPYDETIFIDADCLVYQDINFLWTLFEEADDFSCFGSVLPMDSKEGWFTSEVQDIYPIHFITHLHGMLYFIRKGDGIDRMAEWCQNLIAEYHKVSYKAFNAVLADEPVLALAMAIMDYKPIDRKPEYYCFVPFSTELSANYYRKKVSYSNPKDGHVAQCCIVHWGNKNTQKARYRTEMKTIDDVQALRKRSAAYYRLVYIGCYAQDQMRKAKEFMSWFVERIHHKIQSIGKK